MQKYYSVDDFFTNFGLIKTHHYGITFCRILED